MTGKRIGRPSTYSQDLADEVCERIACGESLKSIAREASKPDERQFYRWLRDNETFRQQYALAREAQGDADADSVSDIGQRALSGEIDPNAARVAIDALKWSAGKRKPKVYGDRIDHNHGGQPGNPLTLLLSEVSGKSIGVSSDDD